MATFSGESSLRLFFFNLQLLKQLLPAEKSWHLRQNPFTLANLKIIRGIEAQNNPKLGHLNDKIWHAVRVSEHPSRPRSCLPYTQFLQRVLKVNNLGAQLRLLGSLKSSSKKAQDLLRKEHSCSYPLRLDLGHLPASLCPAPTPTQGTLYLLPSVC